MNVRAEVEEDMAIGKAVTIKRGTIVMALPSVGLGEERNGVKIAKERIAELGLVMCVQGYDVLVRIGGINIWMPEMNVIPLVQTDLDLEGEQKNEQMNIDPKAILEELLSQTDTYQPWKARVIFALEVINTPSPLGLKE